MNGPAGSGPPWSSPAGPRSGELFAAEQQLLGAGLQSVALSSGLALDRGEGALLFDVDGRAHIDFMAGVGVASVGHAHPRHVAAISRQAARLSVGSLTTEVRLELLRRLVPLLPGKLGRLQLYSGGAEAVEAAIRLAKSCTGRGELVAFRGGYHGKTNLTLALSGALDGSGLGPFPAGVHILPYGDCARCPLRLRHPGCELACLAAGRRQLARAGVRAAAAVIVEPIQGTAGNVVPPDGFLRGVQRLARELDALFVVDEMITGFGRAGTMFACERRDVAPDILVLGKGMAGGFPVAAVATTEEHHRAEPFGRPSGSSSSYGGNPLAAAAALATLEIIIDEGLVQRSRQLGRRLRAGLAAMARELPVLRAVRGHGLMVGADLVDPDSGELLAPERCARLFRAALRRGLLAFVHRPRLRLNPPLVIDAATLDRGLDRLHDALVSLGAGGRPGVGTARERHG